MKQTNAYRDREELDIILGIINYIAKCAPKLSEITNPIRYINLPNILSFYGTPHNRMPLKRSNTLLPLVPTAWHILMLQSALGASIIQESKPVAFASKTMTKSNVNYAQIEKEMFAILPFLPTARIHLSSVYFVPINIY